MGFPKSIMWFSKLNLNHFTPWSFNIANGRYSFADDAFQREMKSGRSVATFGNRQDMDTFAGFEIVDNVITERVIVFHPSFSKNNNDWTIIESEHISFFDFLKNIVLPDMEYWIEDEDINNVD